MKLNLFAFQKTEIVQQSMLLLERICYFQYLYFIQTLEYTSVKKKGFLIKYYKQLVNETVTNKKICNPINLIYIAICSCVKLLHGIFIYYIFNKITCQCIHKIL